MKLFHGSPSDTAPVVKVGAYAMAGENVFDGLFASASFDSAASHGGNVVYTYEVADEKIAESRDLDARFEEVYTFLRDELEIDDVEDIADRIMWDNDRDIMDFFEIISPRMAGCDIDEAAASWELQRLRGRVAAHLGFDAVEMDDEHGTSYLIVNPKIIAE